MHILDFDFDNDRYDYSIDSKYLKSFSTIYEALDGILIEKRTLKQLLLETDFDFYSIT